MRRFTRLTLYCTAKTISLLRIHGLSYFAFVTKLLVDESLEYFDHSSSLHIHTDAETLM